jgi:ribulose-5-phosphate 4-epimerase/fuculose-1-phosphate aldolase
LIKPYGLHWSRIRASQLVVIDLARGTHADSGSVDATAFHTHSAIHRRYRQARAVLHAHTLYATALGLIENGALKMIEQNAMRFLDRIEYVDAYGGLADNLDEANRLAEAMNGKPIAFWRSHGIVVTAPSLCEAFNDLYFLERACRLQVLTRSMGVPTVTVPPHVVERTCRQMRADSNYARLHFEALQRMLDEEEPHYRQ